MLDIVTIAGGQDMGFADTAVTKAANVIGTQVGTLSFQTEFGVDLDYFLQEGVQFQNASFKSYLINALTINQVNVSQVIDVIDRFTETFGFYVDDAGKNMKGLIR